MRIQKFLSLGLLLFTGCISRLDVTVDLYTGTHYRTEYAHRLLSLAQSLPGMMQAEMQPNNQSAHLPCHFKALEDGSFAAEACKDLAAPMLQCHAAPPASPEREATCIETEKKYDLCAANYPKNLGQVAQTANTLCWYINEIKIDEGKMGNSGASKLRKDRGQLDNQIAELELAIGVLYKKHPALGSTKDAEISALLNPFSNAAVAGAEDAAGRVVGYPIFERLIPRVLDDPGKAAWTQINRNLFSAVGGNAQFVVVREGLVSFQEKSLDFDPTPVIGAGAAMARLGLQIAAAMATGSMPALGNGKTAQDSAAAASISESEMTEQRALLKRREAARLLLLDGLAGLTSETDSAAAQEKAKQLLLHYRKQVESNSSTP